MANNFAATYQSPPEYYEYDELGWPIPTPAFTERTTGKIDDLSLRCLGGIIGTAISRLPGVSGSEVLPITDSFTKAANFSDGQAAIFNQGAISANEGFQQYDLAKRGIE